MAIDTAEKRASAAGIPYGWAGVSLTPNAAKDAEWRQESGWGYPGIAVGSIVIAATLGDLTSMWMSEYVPELKAAHITGLDVDTLVRDDLTTVLGFTNYPNTDYDTIYAIYLSST